MLIEECPCWKKSTHNKVLVFVFPHFLSNIIKKKLFSLFFDYWEAFWTAVPLKEHSKENIFVFSCRTKKEMFLFIQFVRRDRWKSTYSLLDVMIILAVFMTNNKWLKFFQTVNAVGAGSIDAFQTYHKLRLIFMHAKHIHLIKIRKKKISHGCDFFYFLFCAQL